MAIEGADIESVPPVDPRLLMPDPTGLSGICRQVRRRAGRVTAYVRRREDDMRIEINPLDPDDHEDTDGFLDVDADLDGEWYPNGSMADVLDGDLVSPPEDGYNS